MYLQLQVPEPAALNDPSAKPETDDVEEILITCAGSSASESLARSSVRLAIYEK
jgi:hypothetical protein